MTILEKYLSKKENLKNSGAIAILAGLDHLRKHSPKVAAAIIQELKDQRSHLKMIASENFCSLAVQLAMGNWMTDKYSEGIPFKRFYAGCDNVDTVESLAIEELKKLFGCDHAYVQPHSGADANLVAYWAILMQRVQSKELEDMGKKTIDELTAKEYEQIRQIVLKQKIMGLSLNSGGHLTHGYRHNVSSKMFEAITYDIDPKTERINYDLLEAQVKKERPLILVVGYSSYSRLINFAKMREIADTVGATLMVDMAHFSGLVAGKVMTGDYNPVPFAHIVTSTTHKTLRGPRGGMILCKEEFKDAIDKGCPLVLGGPLPHVMAAKAISFEEANTSSFQAYAQQIVKNAKALSEKLMSHGVKIITDGTDNHLMVVDVATSFGLNGRQAENAVREAGMTVNRNAIPFDKNGPWYTSGIRIGTPALTTLGMKEKEMECVADLLVLLLKNTKPASAEGGTSHKAKVDIEPKILSKVQLEVKQLLRHFPLYPELEIDF